MDSVYRVETTNKFELFASDEDDPLEIINNINQKSKEKQSSKISTAGNSQSTNNLKTNQSKKSTKSASVETTKQHKDQKNRNESTQKLKLSSNRMNVRQIKESTVVKPGSIYIEEKENHKSSVNADFTSIRENVKDRGQNSFNRRGGTTRMMVRSGRREFDRHSGTEKSSVKAPGKRDGGGSYNWGTIKDDLDVQLNGPTGEDDSARPAEETEEQTPADNKEDETEKPDNDINETGNMTLDEWKALQTAQRMKSSFNIRKAGEGCKDVSWKNMYVLKKKLSDETQSDEYEEDDEENNNYGEKHLAVPIEIRFKDTPRRGRGGRTRRGDGRPEGSIRKQTNIAPNMSDELDFPTLSK